MPVLEYTQWRRFDETIIRAIAACKGSNNNVSDHFANVGKIVKAGATSKPVKDYHLSRYACYLIAQNSDSRKKVRQTIKELGGTMPEDLPTPNKSAKQIERQLKKRRFIA